MFVAGVVIAVIGTIGVFTAVGMEIKFKEPIYLVLMKIFPWFIGLGIALIGWGMRGG